jgi:hypothetical protein
MVQADRYMTPTTTWANSAAESAANSETADHHCYHPQTCSDRISTTEYRQQYDESVFQKCEEEVLKRA